jgi:hypothetical protein
MSGNNLVIIEDPLLNIFIDKDRDFEMFCENYLDVLYTPGLPYKNQADGYKRLREMVCCEITPHPEECWGESLKFLQFLHPILRPFIRKYWHFIKHFRTGPIY